MLKNWIKIFLYQAKRNKVFTALNTLGLSLGIAGLVFAILYWNDEHSYNAWNPEKEKVHQVLSHINDDMIWAHSVYPLAKYMKDMPEIEEFCYLNNWYFDEIVQYGQKKEKIKILDSQPNFFSLFPFEFIRGNAKTALPDSGSIAISDEVATRLFGDQDPIGKTIKYSGRQLVVRGVYHIPGKSSYSPAAVTSLIYETRLKGNEDQWGNFNFCLLLKVKPQNAAGVQKKLEGLFMEYKTKPSAKEEGIDLEEYLKANPPFKISLEKLADARLHSITEGYPEGRGNYQFLLIMAGLSVLILILSITNYINLATANAIKRAKEVGVRKVLGAGKGNIIKQFVFETIIITITALLLALVIVELALPFYNDFLNKTLVLNSSLFYMQLVITFIIVVVTAGILPAVYVANFETLNVLRGNFTRSKSGVWARNAMLVVQFAIASFFIVGSYIVYEQVSFMANKDLGLSGAQVINVVYRKVHNDSTSIIFNNYDRVKQEVKKIPGVINVSGAAFSLADGAASSSGFTYHNKNIQAQNMAMDFEFIDMMKIKMASGRNLSEKFASDTISSMMINETAAKMMHEKDPIGKIVDWNSQKLKIVGVVKDFHMYGPQAPIPPMSFFHLKTVDWMLYNMDKMYIKVDPNNIEQTLAALDKYWTAKVDTEYPFQYEFVDKAYERTYQSYIKQRNLFSLLNIVVIFIALVGLFALASYSIQRRMKEIAIRKTLGAETGTLLRELSKQYIIFCIIGFAIAFVPAWMLLDMWLDNFAFRIPVSVIPFVVGFVVLMVLTLTVVLSRAFIATRTNVLPYLKTD
ncbi:ABC transporter permease [Flavobacterium psychrotrophum]|uniref:ABC transporter permease n=1 Tax=Flavobacterium psychrotrophum TaxID=2294119 RepID=UPI000E30BE11|nr:ABC transporter permease [Flavobacterium psychrotrophum]